MKISTILDHIDSGHMALPEFQRGYVWNGDQVRKLFTSLYLRRPVGGLLVWATESKTAAHRGDGALAAGVVKLLLDGQQRITSLYGVVRGRPPKFFDGNVKAFTGLRFHLDAQSFEFYQPLKMRDDPLWIDVTDLMKKGTRRPRAEGLRVVAEEAPCRLSRTLTVRPVVADQLVRARVTARSRGPGRFRFRRLGRPQRGSTPAGLEWRQTARRPTSMKGTTDGR